MTKAAIETEVKTTTQNRPSSWARFWNALKEFEEAADYGPYDYLNDRLTHIEKELQELRKTKSNQ
jgi:hypothetical protein